VKPDHNKRLREDDENPSFRQSRHISEISLVSTSYFIAPTLGNFFLASGC
jgi:hypothetical protein